MQPNIGSRTAVLALALLVAIGGLSLVVFPASAGITDQQNNATSASVSDWNDSTTVTDLDNSSKNATIQIDFGVPSATADKQNFTLTLSNNATGRVVHETTRNWTAVNASEGNFNLSVTYGTVFETLERDAGENVTVDVNVTYTGASSETLVFQIFAENDNDSAVLVSTGEDDGATIVNESGGLTNALTLGFIGNGSTSVAAAEVEDDVGVDSSKTENITVVMDNSDLETAFSDVADQSSGDLATNGYLILGEKAIPLFPQSADASWLDTSSETYATVNSAGDQVTIWNANESLDTSNVTVRTVGSEAPGFWRTHNMVVDYGGSFTKGVTVASGARNLDGNPFEEGGGLALPKVASIAPTAAPAGVA